MVPEPRIEPETSPISNRALFLSHLRFSPSWLWRVPFSGLTFNGLQGFIPQKIEIFKKFFILKLFNWFYIGILRTESKILWQKINNKLASVRSEVIVFWDVTPCILVYIYRRLYEYPPEYTASYSRKRWFFLSKLYLQTSYTLLWLSVYAQIWIPFRC
jgi:hypothetical protein